MQVSITRRPVRPEPRRRIGLQIQLVAFAAELQFAAKKALGLFGDSGPPLNRVLMLFLGGPLLWLIRYKEHCLRRDCTQGIVDDETPGLNCQVRFSERVVSKTEYIVHSACQIGLRRDVESPLGDAAGLALMLAAIVGIVSIDITVSTGGKFATLPPAVHDEYSYLFQAETFLAGHISFPSHEQLPELFDQVHVLNEGKFVSRYLPGTGLWLTPFAAIGQLYLGHWLAGMLISLLVFGIGRELGGNLCGFVAGMVTAAAPGMAFFGNFLLSHHPTLVGLTFCVFSFCRMCKTLSWAWAIAAGCGLAFAILCRPLTAAAVALPFGLQFTRWVWKLPAKAALQLAAALGSPLCVVAIGIFFYNQAVTGTAWKSPWSLYNEVYTPSHAYGFNNAVHGAARPGPKVMVEYDRWAENLTVEKAIENAGTRLVESWNWTLGTVPLGMAGLVVLLSPAGRRVGWPLLASIASLHAVYIPYWFRGILNWHYVFESLALWALVFGLATRLLFDQWRWAGRRLLTGAWLTVAVMSLFASYVPFEGGGMSWFDQRIAPFRQMRLRHAKFRNLVDERVVQRPALVLVEQPPLNFHTDFVVNPPGLDGSVLFGRYWQDKHKLEEIAKAFPARTIYIFQEDRWEIQKLE